MRKLSQTGLIEIETIETMSLNLHFLEGFAISRLINISDKISKFLVVKTHQKTENILSSPLFQMKQSRSAGKADSEQDYECRCSVPSLGQLQKKFLDLIAKLFYKHGKFVRIQSLILGLVVVKESDE